MSEERINEIIDILNSPHLRCYLPNACNELLQVNINLQQKVEQLEKENERLNNIINELEKWLIEQQREEGEFCDFFLENKQIKVEEVLDKLKELKDDNK